VHLKQDQDVIVIGGGPAGSTVATLLAEAGRSVTLFERDATPKFRIGESLMPGTYWTFKRLGILDKLKESSFPRKYSVQFYGASGKGSAPFYFNQNDPHESSVTWQVLRSEFDPMLRENAREHGVDVVTGASVREVIFDGDRAKGVRVQLSDGDLHGYSARVIVDATGQSAFISRKLKIVKSDQDLKKASIFTHYENGHRDEGMDEGATLILQSEHKDSWFWYIPMPDNRVSVGVVGDLDYLFADRSLDAQAIFDRELQICKPVLERLSNASQAFPVSVTKDFTYRATRLSGDGWVLVGDAYGFLDPVYSTGLFLALKSGEMAADSINEAFEADDFSGERLGNFKEEYLAGMESMNKLVHAFYSSEFNFGKFLRAHPECQQGIVDILSGNVYRKDVTSIFKPMAEMCKLSADVD
jgi:flavin-dependent dehydrogenase